MKQYELNQLAPEEVDALCQRPAIDFESIFGVVRGVLDDVKANKDEAVRRYTEKFDGILLQSFEVSDVEIEEACERIPPELKKAFELAAQNIKKFHKASAPTPVELETSKGVVCKADYRGIEKVGLYVPGGTAPLPSTVLMLGIPARIAECKEIVMCTPPNKEGKVPDIILYAARLAGITKIFKIGGAQAVAAMGYGTETVPKVYKIFGPGNQYVTSAKMLLSIEPNGAAMDMPAGPSEVLVIADETARADFVAADLLSQAEHGTDSQVVLGCPSSGKIEEILKEVRIQLAKLSRAEIAEGSLENSFALKVSNIAEAIEFSDKYAPEHLIINTENARKYAEQVQNAGSVFIGSYSPESAGDYASGTNHTLPTYGYARNYSGVSVSDFMKKITFQELSEEGVRSLGETVEKMAEVEGLGAHKNAMTVRIKSLKDE